MKTVAFLVLVIYVTQIWCGTFSEREGFDDCLKESKLTKDDVTSHTAWQKPEGRCFFKCLMQKSGEIDSNGKPMWDIMEKKLLNLPSINDKQKEDFKKCMAGVDKIEKCEDMEKMAPCMQIIRKNLLE